MNRLVAWNETRFQSPRTWVLGLVLPCALIALYAVVIAVFAGQTAFALNAPLGGLLLVGVAVAAGASAWFLAWRDFIKDASRLAAFLNLTHGKSGVGLLLVDENQNIIGWNKTILKTWAHSEESLQSKRLDDLILTGAGKSGEGETARTGYLAIASSIRKYLCIRKDGSHTPIHVQSYSGKEFGQNGNVLFVILEQKELIKEEERHRLQQSVDLSQDAIWYADARGQVVDMNPRAQELLEYRSFEVNSYGGISALFSAREDWKILERDLSVQGRWAGEIELRTKSGRLVPVALRAAVLLTDRREASEWIGVATDISNEVRAQEVLSQSFAHWQALLDAAVDLAFIITDPAGTLTALSAGAARMLGVDAAAAIGHRNLEEFHLLTELEDHASLANGDAELTDPLTGQPPQTPWSTFLAAITAGKLGDDLWTYQSSDGEHCIVSLEASVLREQEGELTGYLFLAHNRTEQTRERRALQHSQERFITAVQGAGVGIWDWDVERNQVFLSPRWKEILGYRDDELRDSFETWETLLHPADHAHSMKTVFQQLNRDDQRFEIEQRLMHKDGAYRHILNHGIAVNDPQGRIRRVAGSILDITQRRRVEDARARLLAVVEAASDFVGTLTPKGRFIYLNDALRRWAGLARETPPSRITIDDLLTDDSRERFHKHALPVVTVKRSWHGELVMKHANGKTAPVSIVVLAHAPHESGGDPDPSGTTDGHNEEYYSLIARDITEIKHNERELQAAKETADSASAAKSLFMANMSHEIRNPMNAVINLTGLLLESPLNDQQLDYIQIIRQSGESLIRLLNDILDFSKIESGRLEIESHPFRVRDCFQSAAAMYMHNARAKSLALECELAADLPDVVLGDVTRLRQVLTNLISNAIKFTENGSILIKTYRGGPAPANTNTSGDPAKFLMICEVRDTGIGIPRDDQEKLFQNYQQADSSTYRRYGGTGLGLSICKHLVHLMGGTLTLASDIGAGSNFTFSVAVVAAENAPAEKPPSNNHALAHFPSQYNTNLGQLCPLSILVAEDTVMNQKVMIALLNRIGYAPDIAATGLDVLERLRKKHYDLVFMDVNMPDLDGLETTRVILAHCPEDKRPAIIALSAGALSEDYQRCINAGMDDYICKPIHINDLEDCLRRVHARVTNRKSRLAVK